MAIGERIELLKSNILHYTKDLLEVRRRRDSPAGSKTGELVTLLSEGIDGAEQGGSQLFATTGGQRRDRLCCRHRQQLPLRRHHRKIRSTWKGIRGRKAR